MSTAFGLLIAGRAHTLPPGAQLIIVPPLGLALIRAGSRVQAWGTRGRVKHYSERELLAMWNEWVLK